MKSKYLQIDYTINDVYSLIAMNKWTTTVYYGLSYIFILILLTSAAFGNENE
jgi:hypothetical protein